MDIQFIDITSYRGISSNAEHFYAKVGKPEHTQEIYLINSICEVNEGVWFQDGEHLLFYPTKEEATQLWEKDNKWDKDEFVIKHKEDSIMEMVEDGTYRFPSIIEVVKAAKKKFPDSLLCFSLEHSREEFARWLFKCYENEKTKAYAVEILDIIGVK